MNQFFLKSSLGVIMGLTFLFSNAQEVNTSKFDNVVNWGAKVIYKNGYSLRYYATNGISITNTLQKSYNYGKYWQINIEVENLTGESFVFNPNDIVVYLTKYQTDKKTKIVSVKHQEKGAILSYDTYMEKVNNKQSWSSLLNKIGENNNAQSAGYYSQSTTTSVTGNSNSYGSVSDYYGNSLNVNATTNSSAQSSNVVNGYNGQAAYNALQNANKNIAAYDEQLYRIKSVISQGYLRINTLENGQRLTGMVNMQYEDADKIELLIPVNGKYYSFVYRTDIQSTGQSLVENKPVKEISDNEKVKTLYEEAKTQYNNKNFQESLDKINEALKIDSNNTNLLTYRGWIYYYPLNNKELGISDYEKAINIYPSSYNNIITLCEWYYWGKNYVKALELSNQAIKLDPNKIEGYFNRALVKSATKDRYGSINDYEKIISISNNSLKPYDGLGVIYNNLGYSYVEIEDYNKALPLINKALQLLPNHSYIWGSRGELFYRTGEYKKCIEDMSVAIDLEEKGNAQGASTDKSIPYYYRGLSYLKKGKKKESCFDLSKAVELGNKDAIQVLSQNCK